MEVTPITIARGRMGELFRSLRSIYRKSKKSSEPSGHRTTASDPTIPPSVFPVPDPRGTLENTRLIHDVVLSSETVGVTSHLFTTDDGHSSGSSSSLSCKTRSMKNEPDLDPTPPNGEHPEPPSLLESDERQGEPEENSTSTSAPTMPVVLPSSPSPATSIFPGDDARSIHTSDAGKVTVEEGVQVEITQAGPETDSQYAEDEKFGSELPDGWWEPAKKDSEDDTLQDLYSIPSTSTPPYPAEASVILSSADGTMFLTLRDFLGAGSYGKVLSADWGGRQVAVKISHKLFISELDTTERGLSSLKTELDILKALKESRKLGLAGSQFFPELFKSWQDAANVYFVMEMYVCNLDDFRCDNPEWYEDTATGDKVLWAAEMILGLQALHRMRILHRDIKPGNIFITSSKHIVIGDYGLACAWLDPYYGEFPSSSLRARDSPGTLEYLAPEVVRGFYEDQDNADVKKYVNCGFEADIWSLGVTICESWSCRGLFVYEKEDGDQEYKVVIPSKILSRDVTPNVKKIVRNHPIWHLIMRMLDKNQNSRIGFNEIMAHPVFAHLDWNAVAMLGYTPALSFPKVEPCSGPKYVGDEIRFPSFYQLSHPEDDVVGEMDSKGVTSERGIFRRAMGFARDWVSQQQIQIAYDTLCEHDFDWTPSESSYEGD